jgi:hypothetical protein
MRIILDPASTHSPSHMRRARLLAVALLFPASATLTSAQQPRTLRLPASSTRTPRRQSEDWAASGSRSPSSRTASVVFAKGYGVRELGKPGAVDCATLFAIGSTTKAMTAAAMGMLVDEGKVRWDDPVTNYLPGFQLRDPYITREITVRDLLTHPRRPPERGLPLVWQRQLDRRDPAAGQVRGAGVFAPLELHLPERDVRCRRPDHRRGERPAVGPVRPDAHLRPAAHGPNRAPPVAGSHRA